MNEEIDHVLSFWFSGGTQAVTRWFRPPAGFDEEVRTSFLPLISQARSHELDSWTDTPLGSLALIILLDQFPRNVYRGSDGAHASDAQACSVATNAIARGYDHQVDDLQALFFYMPLMHDERLVSQVACVAQMETLYARCQQKENAEAREAREFVEQGLKSAKGHRDTILKFGRFPSRNKILGRESTEEEKKFLEENPSGFL
ncbi:uncharacterized protein Z518_01655 [Rhinocladiella mackenziei CBS 650.93]|uniref:DUF924-domain-containing protein n=1 Tax=Rhinocladiella mackenziei CBS 650.93 TaxID=1442369 RepID=A0A0D2J4G1_9EURO|nr:uncharacterized protein Z518_01655 [Rhinocladiella mackenziei CBS 650.93]KIX10571.1 hypothetical protein Z518_01655 [Rhinocladiella mackenziei CBS 650.93]